MNRRARLARVRTWLRRRLVVPQEGATAAMVALILPGVLIGSAVIAVDAGQLWEGRRNVIVATDAAALAAAQEYALGGDGCAIAPDHIADNDGAAAMTGCTTAGAGLATGTVTVSASTLVEVAFAGVLGFGDQDVDSSTTAMWATTGAANHLRPLGLCEGHPDVAAWLAIAATATQYPPAGLAPARIYYTHLGPESDEEAESGEGEGSGEEGPCGEASGNWGLLDFDGGANSNAELKDWLLNGYDGTVEFPSSVGGDTGAFSNSLDSALSTLQSEGTVICLPVFSTVSGEGSNADFALEVPVALVIEGFLTTGSEHERYIDVRFQRGLCPGEPDPGAVITGAYSVLICATDHSDMASCS